VNTPTTTDDDRTGRAQWLRAAASRTGRIARWEVSRSLGTADRKTVAVLVAVLIVVGVVGIAVADDGVGLEEEIYVVGVDEASPYYDVAVESEQFRPLSSEDVLIESDAADANVDVVVTEHEPIESDMRAQSTTRVELTAYGETGDAAANAFRDAIEAYNEALMAQEDDVAAAYPVEVTIEYRERAGTAGDREPDDGSDADDSPSAASDSANETSDDDGPIDDPDSGDGAAPGADDGLDSGDGATPGADDGPDSGDGAAPGSDDEAGGEAPGGDDHGDDGDTDTDGATQGSAIDDEAIDGPESGPPGTISPPFPFESLILAFLFVVPMNFIIQAYGSTIMDERIKRRGELLLVSPASPAEIVAGKTLPYFCGLLAVAVGIALAVGGGPLSIAAATPIALLFLGSTFAGAMLARSFKELTFVTVTISVFLTTYTFIPAIFTDVNPIALISPLTLVVMDLQGESARLGEYLFSTGPFYLSAAVLFVLGIGLYREEDMFDQKPISEKLVDAIASRITGYRSIPLLSILFIPFVFTAQLLAVALLFAVPEQLALPVIFVLAAAIEEAAKSVHVYAGFARSRFEATLRNGVVLGVLSGTGFFIGEKFTHVAQFVGLPDLTVGLAAFGPALSSNPLVVLALFLAPLFLHVLTAIITAIAATRGENVYAIGFFLATLVHAGYNLGVISLAG